MFNIFGPRFAFNVNENKFTGVLKMNHYQRCMVTFLFLIREILEVETFRRVISDRPHIVVIDWLFPMAGNRHCVIMVSILDLQRNRFVFVSNWLPVDYFFQGQRNAEPTVIEAILPLFHANVSELTRVKPARFVPVSCDGIITVLRIIRLEKKKKKKEMTIRNL